MQFYKKMLIKLLLIIFINGCTWLGNEKERSNIYILHKTNNQFQPKIIWKRLVGNGTKDFYSNLHPAWQKTFVFAADRHGLIRSLDLNSGKVIWSTDLSIHTDSLLKYKKSILLSGGITIHDNYLYIGSELAKLYALNVQNGNVIWETSVAGEVLSIPVVTNGVILIHTGNGMLQALDRINGTINWTISLDVQPLNLRGKSAPVIDFDIAILGNDNGLISAISIDQGQLIWQQDISRLGDKIKDIKTTPILADGIVYAAAYNGNLAALDLRDGQIIWLSKIGSISNLLMDKKCIYLVDQKNRILSIDIKYGITLWYQDKLIDHNLTSPILYKGYIVICDEKGYLYWINTINGQIITKLRINKSGFIAQPIIAKDKLILQAKDGVIYALDY